jgi:hypothetical protein
MLTHWWSLAPAWIAHIWLPRWQYSQWVWRQLRHDWQWQTQHCFKSTR